MIPGLGTISPDKAALYQKAKDIAQAHLVLKAVPPRRVVPPGTNAVYINDTRYPEERVVDLYKKTTTPKEGYFFEGDRAKGYITSDYHTRLVGEVGFQTYYPEIGDFHYNTPEELGIARVTAAPLKEIGQMGRAFQQRLETPEGRGLYVNRPISDHRARAYEKQGFSNTEGNLQYLDNRRFKETPTMAEVYLYGDSRFLQPELPDLYAATSEKLAEAIDKRQIGNGSFGDEMFF